jgi:hypothetical protein
LSRPVIISASRRTDIPAFFMDWFLAGARHGEIQLAHPYRPRLVRRIDLSPQVVGAVVFWSKNPLPLLARLDEIQAWCPRLLLHFTLNAYGREFEPGLPGLGERLELFEKLSRRLGREKVIWRYDPIVLSSLTDWDWHRQAFSRLCRRLAESTFRVVISLVDYYRKTDRALKDLEGKGRVFFREAESDPRTAQLLGDMAREANAQGLEIFTCAEEKDWTACGITPGACIDGRLLARLYGLPAMARDRHQRPCCLCSESVDIGSYATCLHGCRYCYAR